MKKIIVSIILIISAVNLMANMLYAQEKNTNNSQSDINSQKNIKPKQKEKKWTPTFVPSEKIDADSSVSFPVDI